MGVTTWSMKITAAGESTQLHFFVLLHKLGKGLITNYNVSKPSLGEQRFSNHEV